MGSGFSDPTVSMLALVVALVAGAWASVAAQAQGAAAPKADATIWQGVYTDAQAARGEAVYQSTCLRCHGADLGGGRQGGIPALKGDSFWESWEGTRVGTLFTTVQNTMPRDAPASLTNDVYLDVIAYILKANALPATAAEPGLTAALAENIKIEKKGGQKDVPNFALVEIVGCLSRGDRNDWRLTSTTDPVVTKEDSATPRELKEAESRPLGTQAIRLVGAAPFKPDGHDGHRMEAKGLLSRAPNDNRIDVTFLQMVGTACAK